VPCEQSVPHRRPGSTGDPAALQSASVAHSDLADGLDSHAATIATTAGSTAGSWQGDAAASYQQLSQIVRAHFSAAAATSRTAADTLRRYAAELEFFQQEGQHALTQAEHWLSQADSWTSKLTAANREVATQEAAVANAKASLSCISHATPASVSAAAAAAASSKLVVEQQILTVALSTQSNARSELQKRTEAAQPLAAARRTDLERGGVRGVTV
jgi:uncharacterized protein YukE